MAPFSVGRVDMIQSAFYRFNLIFFDEAICSSPICILEKNGAIFVHPRRQILRKILSKNQKSAFLRKMAPFFILILCVQFDRIFQGL